jgi:hypothetical protein
MSPSNPQRFATFGQTQSWLSRSLAKCEFVWMSLFLKGKSLNDNVIRNSIKVTMTSSQRLKRAILQAGKHSTMLKFDNADATGMSQQKSMIWIKRDFSGEVDTSLRPD